MKSTPKMKRRKKMFFHNAPTNGMYRPVTRNERGRTSRVPGMIVVLRQQACEQGERKKTTKDPNKHHARVRARAKGEISPNDKCVFGIS